jgi:hypothetical protein
MKGIYSIDKPENFKGNYLYFKNELKRIGNNGLVERKSDFILEVVSNDGMKITKGKFPVQ